MHLMAYTFVHIGSNLSSTMVLGSAIYISHKSLTNCAVPEISENEQGNR